MSCRLKKVPFLKKKDSKESQPQINNKDPRWWDDQEVHFSSSRPSTSSANEQTTKILPLIVTSIPAPMAVRQKFQLPALVLPDLTEKILAKTPLRASQEETKCGQKEAPALPKVPETERAPGKKRTPESVLTFYPARQTLEGCYSVTPSPSSHETSRHSPSLQPSRKVPKRLFPGETTCCAQFMKGEEVTSKQVEELFLALQDMQGDWEASVAQAAAEAKAELLRH